MKMSQLPELGLGLLCDVVAEYTDITDTNLMNKLHLMRTRNKSIVVVLY